MLKKITPTALPAMGDIRSLGSGDIIQIDPAVRQHKQWSRYVDAIASAVSKGASVRWPM